MMLFSLNKYQKSCVIHHTSLIYSSLWSELHSASGLIMTVLNQDNNSQNFIIRDQHQISIQLHYKV